MNKKHNKRHTRIYKEWQGIKYRTKKTNDESRNKSYYEKGIKVCDEWLDKETGFLNFYEWAMANGYRDDLTIDRIDNNGNYEPSNCRWVTMTEQANNKSTNRLITYNGKTQTAMQWAKKLGMNYSLIINRLNRGWSVERIFNNKTDTRQKKVTYNGNEFTLQNDMGNAKLENVKLPAGYVPVGTAEYGGIVYIASYNPITKKGQIGSYPSPR